MRATFHQLKLKPRLGRPAYRMGRKLRKVLRLTMAALLVTSHLQVAHTQTLSTKTSAPEPTVETETLVRTQLDEIGTEIDAYSFEKEKEVQLVIKKLNALAFKREALKQSFDLLKKQYEHGQLQGAPLQSAVQNAEAELLNWRRSLVDTLLSLGEETFKPNWLEEDAPREIILARNEVNGYFNLTQPLYFLIGHTLRKNAGSVRLQELTNRHHLSLPEKVYRHLFTRTSLPSDDISSSLYESNGQAHVALRWRTSRVYWMLLESLQVGDASENYLPTVRCLLGQLLHNDLSQTNLFLRHMTDRLAEKTLNANLCLGISNKELLNAIHHNDRAELLESEFRQVLLEATPTFEDELVQNTNYISMATDSRIVVPNFYGDENSFGSALENFRELYLFPEAIITAGTSPDGTRHLSASELREINTSLEFSIKRFMQSQGAFYSVANQSGLTSALSGLLQDPQIMGDDSTIPSDEVSKMIESGEVLYFSEALKITLHHWPISLEPLYKRKDKSAFYRELSFILAEAKARSLSIATGRILSYLALPDIHPSHTDLIQHWQKKIIQPYLGLANPPNIASITTSTTNEIAPGLVAELTKNIEGRLDSTYRFNYQPLKLIQDSYIQALAQKSHKIVSLMTEVSPYELPYSKTALRVLFNETISGLKPEVQNAIDDILNASSFSQSQALYMKYLQAVSEDSAKHNLLPHRSSFWSSLKDFVGFSGTDKTKKSIVDQNASYYQQLQKVGGLFGWSTTGLPENGEDQGEPQNIGNILHVLGQDLSKNEMESLILDYRRYLRAEEMSDYKILEIPVKNSNCVRTKENEKLPTRLYEALYCLQPQGNSPTQDATRRVVIEALQSTRWNVHKVLDGVSQAQTPNDLAYIIRQSKAVDHLLGQQTAAMQLALGQFVQQHGSLSWEALQPPSFVNILQVHHRAKNCLVTSPHNFFENGKCVTDKARRNKIVKDDLAQSWNQLYHASFTGAYAILSGWLIQVALMRFGGGRAAWLKTIIDGTKSLRLSYGTFLTGIFGADLIWIGYSRIPQVQRESDLVNQMNFTEPTKWDVSFFGALEHTLAQDRFQDTKSALKTEALWDVFWLTLPLTISPTIRGYQNIVQPRLAAHREVQYAKKYYGITNPLKVQGPHPVIQAKYEKIWRKKSNYFAADFKRLGLSTPTWNVSELNKALEVAKTHMKTNELHKAQEAYRRIILELAKEFDRVRHYHIALNNMAPAVFKVPKTGASGSSTVSVGDDISAIHAHMPDYNYIQNEMKLLDEAFKKITLEGRGA